MEPEGAGELGTAGLIDDDERSYREEVSCGGWGGVLCLLQAPQAPASVSVSAPGLTCAHSRLLSGLIRPSPLC